MNNNLDKLSQANQYVADGLVAHKTQNLSLAQSLYEKALLVDKNNSDALHLFGMLKAAKGEMDAAISLIESAIESSASLGTLSAVTSSNTIALYHNNLGNIYFQLGDINSAEKYFSTAFSLNPHYIEAEYNLANALLEKNEISRAQAHYKNVLSSSPDFMPAINNLVESYLLENNYLSAYQLLNKVRNLDDVLGARFVDIKFNLGNQYKEKADLINAEKLYSSVLQDNEAYFGAWVNLGVIQMWRGCFDVARDNFESAYKLNDCDYILLNNLGMVCQALKNIEQAKNYYKKAVTLSGNRPEAYWNYSLLLLLNGEYEKGWQYYEYRWQVPDAILDKKRHYHQPVWSGEFKKEKTIFVYCEQGYGDSIQFVRYLLMLINEGMNVVLECPAALARLFSQMHTKLITVNEKDNFSDFDSHIAMMSLPFAFNTTVETIPFSLPYLNVDDSHKNKWRDIMCAEENKIKVGLVWKGNKRWLAVDGENDKQVSGMMDGRRSLSFSDFSMLLKNKRENKSNIQFYSLQKNDEHETLMAENINDDAIGKANDFYDRQQNN